VRTDGARKGAATEPARQRRRQRVGKGMGNTQKACVVGSVVGFVNPAILLSVLPCAPGWDPPPVFIKHGKGDGSFLF
jgi:hypothetical protein